MAQQDQLEYIVKIVDQATGDLQKIANEVSQLQDKIEGSGNAAAASSTSFGKLTAAFGVADLAVRALTAAVTTAQNQFNESIDAANKYASAMIGLSSVASAFGEDQDKATEAAKSLAKDGLMSVAESAAGLKNLLGAGFNLDESTQLMLKFKDAAAFGRQGSLGFGEAIVGATQGIKNQNSIMVDNVGITKNLSIILEEAGYSMQDLSRVTTDASVRQALYNGLLREGEVFSGDAARAAETLKGAQDQLNTSVFNLQATVGQILAPSILVMVNSMNEAANSANNSLQPSMEGIAKGLVVVAGTFIELGEVVRAAARLIISAVESISIAVQHIQKGDIMGAITESWKNTLDDLTSIGLDFGKSFEKTSANIGKAWDKIDREGLGKMPGVMRDALANTGSAVDKGGEQIAKKLEQMATKISDINKNILKESQHFAQDISNKTRDFEEQVRDLVIKHRDAIRDLRQEMSDLKSEFESGEKDRLGTHEDRVKTINEKYAEETQNLKDNLKRRLADTHTSDKQLIKYFEEQVKEKESKRDKEIASENSDYDKAEAKEKTRYEKQLSELQGKLDSELAIEKLHADEFSKFKDAVHEDDITRAQQAFSREIAQMKSQHDERMLELQRELLEVQEMKNKIMGTSVTSNLNYQAKAPSFNQQATKPSASTVPIGPPGKPSGSNPFGISPSIYNLYQTNNNYSQLDLNTAMSKLGAKIK